MQDLFPSAAFRSTISALMCFQPDFELYLMLETGIPPQRWAAAGLR